MRAMYNATEASGLFAADDIKVRLLPFQYFKLGTGEKDFLHIYNLRQR